MKRQSGNSRAAAGLAVVAALLAGSALAADFEAGRGSRCQWARLQFNVAGRWYSHPEGDLNLIKRLRDATSVDLGFDFCTPGIDDVNKMAEYPFLFMHAQYAAKLTDRQRDNLREYLRRGGFLFVDDCVLDSPTADLFFQSMKAELRKILPAAQMVNLSNDRGHEIFRCVYPMPRGLQVCHPLGRNNGLWGVYEKDRLVAVLCSNDLHCDWAQWHGPQSEQEALRMAVNIYVYSMTH